MKIFTWNTQKNKVKKIKKFSKVVDYKSTFSYISIGNIVFT